MDVGGYLSEAFESLERACSFWFYFYCVNHCKSFKASEKALVFVFLVEDFQRNDVRIHSSMEVLVPVIPEVASRRLRMWYPVF